MEAAMKKIENVFSAVLKHRKGRHVLFWVTVYMVFTISRTSLESSPYSPLTIMLMNIHGIVPTMIAAYFLNYFLIPKYFNRGKYLSFLALFTLSAYLISVFARIVTVYLNEPLFRQGQFEQEALSDIFLDIEHLVTFYFPPIYFIAFAMTILKQQIAQIGLKQQNALLEKEKAETELNFLKAQIHPHFLFNTLNNLYVLTLKKSDKAPETVVRLSEILDYILYKGNENLVALDKEIKLLENYIELEKLRYGDTLNVSFNKSIDDIRIEISPLLLLSIVENAFKHGASNQINEPEIKIDLNLKDHFLEFKVFNTKNESSKKDDLTYRKGIGISNIRRQLALIYQDYKFEVEEGKDYYLVYLTIVLKNRKEKDKLKKPQEIS